MDLKESAASVFFFALGSQPTKGYVFFLVNWKVYITVSLLGFNPAQGCSKAIRKLLYP
jgi:hypothetical protein